MPRISLYPFSRILSVLWMSLALHTLANAYDGLVEKQIFTMPTYTTESGRTLKEVKVGYETYGKLNAAKDNAILITHFFSGSSHAAGKYKVEERAPGYWDTIIGSGKAFDTDKYFVISSDTLVNLNVKDPNTTTTGPASIDPDTGKPYGMSFPVVNVRDFVNIQKALLDKFDIKKLAAVAGPSGGGAQALQWAVTYPDMVSRTIAVIPFGIELHPYAVAEILLWSMPIMLDPKWNNGDYYGKEEPIVGLTHALRVTTFSAVSPAWAEQKFSRRWAVGNPLEAFSNDYAVDAGLIAAGQSRAKVVDANHFLYTVKAYQQFSIDADLVKLKSPVLLIPAASDLLFPPERSQRAAQKIRATGNYAEVFILEGDGGHLDGLTRIVQATKVIDAFLKRPVTAKK